MYIVSTEVVTHLCLCNNDALRTLWHLIHILRVQLLKTCIALGPENNQLKKCHCTIQFDNVVNNIVAQLLLLANITTASNGHDNSNQASVCNLALQQHPNLEMKAKFLLSPDTTGASPKPLGLWAAALGGSRYDR